MLGRIKKHTKQPYIIASWLMSVAAFLFVALAFPVLAATTKTYTHTTDKYSFQYPASWSVKKGTKSVSVVPTAKQRNSLKSKTSVIV